MKTITSSQVLGLPGTSLAVRSIFALLAAGALPLLAKPAFAEDATGKVQPQVKDVTQEKVVVTGRRPSLRSMNSSDVETEEIVGKQSYISDTARLIDDVPGVSHYGAGGVSSIPVIHGLNDDRVNVLVNGMTITSACANHMNTPLSYIDRTNVGKVSVLAGITPVSMGGDSIGGSIVVDSPDPLFADPDKGYLINGMLSGFYRSNINAYGGSIGAGIANEHARLDYVGSHSQSSNYKDGNNNTVESSAYQNQNHAATLSFKTDKHLLVIRGGQQHIPFQGFPNQRMDLTNNDSIFGNIMHRGSFDWGTLETRFYIENTHHEMNIDTDKQKFALAPPNNLMPMNTSGKNLGYRIKAEIPLTPKDTLRIGNEYHSTKLDDFWPPAWPNTKPFNGNMMSFMMGPRVYTNINNGERDRVGTFVEWEANWSNEWRSQLGVRHDHTTTNTGDVQPYNPQLLGGANVAGAGVDLTAAKRFNAQDHYRENDTFDVTALARYTPNDMSQFEFGYARKNRAPNLYERYLWGVRAMDMAMNGWFGDGNGYVGNLNLKPETAHTLSFTADIYEPKNADWELKATPYFTYVENFIDADRCPINLGGACTAANQTVNNNFVFLQFANHDARLWGVDVSGRAGLYEDKTIGNLSARGVMSYVRGERMDGGNLYHMMPLNAKLSLDHRLGGWQNSLEWQMVDAKDDVQGIRNEVKTPGYMLVNARTSYQWEKLRIDVGLDNIFDKQFYHPLGGAYLGDRFGMNPTSLTSPPWGRNVAGLGRSVYVGMTLTY